MRRPCHQLLGLGLLSMAVLTSCTAGDGRSAGPTASIVEPAASSAPRGTEPSAGFGVPLDQTPLVIGDYSLTPFHPEARVDLNIREPDLHRAYVIADGASGTPAFAVLTADHVTSNLVGPAFEPHDQLITRSGGEVLRDVVAGADVVTYVDRSRSRPAGVVVVDYPDARVTIAMDRGESVEPIIDFLGAADLRSLLELEP